MNAIHENQKRIDEEKKALEKQFEPKEESQSAQEQPAQESQQEPSGDTSSPQ